MLLRFIFVALRLYHCLKTQSLVYLIIYNKLLNSGQDDSIDVAAIDVVAIGVVAVDVVAIFVVAIDVVGVVAKDFGFIPPANVVLKQFM